MRTHVLAGAVMALALTALAGCGGANGDGPTDTPDISTGFGTEPTSEVAPE